MYTAIKYITLKYYVLFLGHSNLKEKNPFFMVFKRCNIRVILRPTLTTDNIFSQF